MNELFLKKYVASVDGRKMGPKSSTGEIFNQLNFDQKQLPFVDFSPLKGKMTVLPNLDQSSLSSDQRYLLKISLFVQTKQSDSKTIGFIRNSQSGTLNHARWLTTANQILRLYIIIVVSHLRI